MFSSFNGLVPNLFWQNFAYDFTIEGLGVALKDDERDQADDDDLDHLVFVVVDVVVVDEEEDWSD